MKTYRAVIIDDEHKMNELLRLKVEQLCPEIELVGSAENITEGYSVINQQLPDIVFLDINMPGGSGFDLLEKYDKIPFEIIFVTGYSDFALNALRASATDYILKPIKNKDLTNAVSKAIKNREAQDEYKNLKLLKNNLSSENQEEFTLAIPDQQEYHVVKAKDILYCKGVNKYTQIYLLNASHLLSSYNIGKFETMLCDYDFFRCHKSYLINTKFIVSYSSDSMIKLQNDHQIPLSRRKKEEFKEIVNAQKLQ